MTKRKLVVPQVNVVSMSSVEIAELTGKEHFHVKRDCDVMFEELGLDASNFGAIYHDSMNREQTQYLLPKRETLILVSGYSVRMRAKIIDRLEQLESGQGSAAVLAELRKATARIASLEQRMIEPPFVNMTVRSAAKSLKVRESAVVVAMINAGWMQYTFRGNLMATSYATGRGLLTSVKDPLITKLGFEALNRLI